MCNVNVSFQNTFYYVYARVYGIMRFFKKKKKRRYLLFMFATRNDSQYCYYEDKTKT